MSHNYFTPAQLADHWGISANTLRKWRWEGKGPSFVKIGSNVRYRQEDIEAHEASFLFNSTTEYEAV